MTALSSGMVAPFDDGAREPTGRPLGPPPTVMVASNAWGAPTPLCSIDKTGVCAVAWLPFGSMERALLAQHPDPEPEGSHHGLALVLAQAADRLGAGLAGGGGLGAAAVRVLRVQQLRRHRHGGRAGPAAPHDPVTESGQEQEEYRRIVEAECARWWDGLVELPDHQAQVCVDGGYGR